MNLRTKKVAPPILFYYIALLIKNKRIRNMAKTRDKKTIETQNKGLEALSDFLGDMENRLKNGIIADFNSKGPHQYQFNKQASYIDWTIDPEEHEIWIGWAIPRMPNFDHLITDWIKDCRDTFIEIARFIPLLDVGHTYPDSGHDFVMLDLDKVEVKHFTENTLTIEFNG